ncbi:PREDICTED: uncharacterized protein LOC109328548 [Lupinus angustifolius]|uniref:uncharacterized protein LOC109328548 n=1 Tax=Lupinus angustifolius TaxID=3871 RepID=UPI00092F8A8B|nr:PREDICTED: uncharacterized protein LOC109328548 [Lupinus angustifolius]
MAKSHVEVVPLSTISELQSRKTTSKDQDIEKGDVQQHSVVYVYRTKVADLDRNIIVTWCKSTIEHTLSMSVEKNPLEENKYMCKIDLESGQSWGKKGLKSFEIDGTRVDVFWDFREAIFSTGPQPSSCYYVALVYKKEVLLLLGDLANNAYRRTKSKQSSEEVTLLCKKENMYGKKIFCTRVMLEEGKIEHEIVIETSLSGPDDPEMWICINGMLACRIMNLNWRFRGNEVVMVNNLHVQIFWDVHDWLFNDIGSGPGLFIFKPDFFELTNYPNSRECPEKGEDNNNKVDLLEECPFRRGFCHLLYAWRTI